VIVAGGSTEELLRSMPQPSMESELKVVWVSVALRPEALRYFLQFDDPAGEMAHVLSRHDASVNSNVEVSASKSDIESYSPPEREEPVTAAPPPTNSPFEEIRAALENVDKRVEGYGSMKLAAQLAERYFGISWLDLDPTAPGSSTRERLRKVVLDTLPESHSNRSVPWRRFQDFAAECSKMRSKHS
jgi:hypothetical protein